MPRFQEQIPAKRALVVFESMYGNTREVGKAIAAGLRDRMDVQVQSIHTVDRDAVDAADLLVVGGPTHMHGMTTTLSRKAAIQAAEEEGTEVVVDAGEEPGLRGWLTGQSGERKLAAAFDTRIDKSPALTGAASRGIARRLRRRGFELAADPESFFVEDSEGPLADGELERAREWGRDLGERATVIRRLATAAR